MGLADKLGRVIDVITEPESVTKGNDFEKYLVSLLRSDRFALMDWTSDICRKHDRFVEADTRPDLTVRHIKTGQVLHIECKFRSGLFNDKLEWTNRGQLQRYRDFAKQTREPVYVAIGLEGKASKPKYLFVIPLEEAKYPALYPSVFEKYERSTKKNFNVIKGRLV